MAPTPYPELNAVLQELVEGVQAALGDRFVAACLQGSFAVGDFDRHSDVDFIVAADGEPSVAQVHALQAMHERIFGLDCAWAQHLEGSYFPRAVLKDHARHGEPLWYLDPADPADFRRTLDFVTYAIGASAADAAGSGER